MNRESRNLENKSSRQKAKHTRQYSDLSQAKRGTFNNSRSAAEGSFNSVFWPVLDVKKETFNSSLSAADGEL